MGGYTVPGSVPFVPGMYNSEPGTARIADLILRQGDIAANRQARSAEILGSTIAGAGQAVGQGLQQYRQQKDESSIGRAVTEAGQAETANPTGFDISSVTRRYDPRLATRIIKAYGDFSAQADLGAERKARAAQYTAQAQKEAEAAQQHNVDAIGTILSHAEKLGAFDAPDGGLQAYTDIGQAMAAKKMPEAAQYAPQIQQLTALMAQAKASGDPMAVPMVAQRVQQTFGPLRDHVKTLMSPGAMKALADENAPLKGAPGDVFFDKTTHQPIMSVPEKAPNLELKETAQGLQPWNPKTNELGPVIAKGKPPAATIINPAQTDRAKLIADAIESGEQPPDTKGLYRDGPAVKAELAKRHFNLSLAEIDWKATQKHVQTLNGPAQTKLMQSINTLPELLDSVDSLASQWKGGRFPVLNKANLALAKNGAYGSDVASVAVKLDAQIADVTSDLGAVYMGGNTPTDHSLGLAAKALAGEWDEKVLHSMVDLARGNVQIRKNSILNTGVAGASAGNVYAPATPAPAAPAVPSPSAKGAVTVTAPNGKVYSFSSQGEADGFKKGAGIQ